MERVLRSKDPVRSLHNTVLCLSKFQLRKSWYTGKPKDYLPNMTFKKGLMPSRDLNDTMF